MFACERDLETEQKLQYFDPHSYGRQRCVFLVLQGCSTRGPKAHSAGCWLSLLHPISNFSGPQTPSGAPSPFGLVWLSLPHLVYNSVRSLTATVLTSVLTELYNSTTSTRSPTRSLKSHAGPSSSGNNCHAVQRSLSSGASVLESIMGFFTSSHFISQFPPTRFPLITAIRMCHLSGASPWNGIFGRVEGQNTTGRPTKTYLHQLHADTACNLKDPSEAIDDRVDADACINTTTQ